jgi:hypothetical protein
MKIRNLLLGTALALSVLGCGGESSSISGENGTNNDSNSKQVSEGKNTTIVDLSYLESGFKVTTNAGFGEYNGEKIVHVAHEIRQIGKSGIVLLRGLPGVFSTSCELEKRGGWYVSYLCIDDNVDKEQIDESDKSKITFRDRYDYEVVQKISTIESGVVQEQQVLIFPKF